MTIFRPGEFNGRLGELVDFAVVGAQKAGTSSLHSVLRRSGVATVRNSTLFERSGRWQELLEQELGALDAARSSQAEPVALVRPNLLASRETHERLATHNPAMKIHAVLRNPVRRAISAYFHYIRDGHLPVLGADEGLRALLSSYGNSRAGRGREILLFSMYGQSLQSLLEYFAPDQIWIERFEDLTEKPAEYFCRLSKFLGISIRTPHRMPRLEQTPRNLEEMYSAREAIRKRRPGLAPLPVLSERQFLDHSERFGDQRISRHTWIELWSFFSNDLSLFYRLHPSWAPVVSDWMNDDTFVDRGIIPPPKPLKAHPKENKPGIRPRKEFCIGLVGGANPSSLSLIENSIFCAEDAVEKPTSFVADPFLWLESGEPRYVFYETRMARGKIAAARVGNGHKLEPLGVVLEEPFHLSFPQVLDLNNRRIMLVESIESDELRIYESVDFPRTWRFLATLARGKFTDPSIVSWGGENYLFATKDRMLVGFVLAADLSGLEQRIQIATQPDRIHRRMGGHFFEFNGNLYRPSQRNKPSYGYCIDLHVVEELGGNRYRERLVQSPFLPRFGQFELDTWSQRIHHVHLQRCPSGVIGVIDGRDRPGLFSGERRGPENEPKPWPPSGVR